MITVGQISKPQGVRGEVKVRAMTDDPSRFSVLKSVFVGNTPMRIQSVRVSGADVFIKLVGVDDRNAAEKLRGEFVKIERAVAVPLDDGEFFIADLLSAKLVAVKGEQKTLIGVVKNIQSFGAADVFTVALENGGEMTFAFVKALNAAFNEQTHELEVDGDRLSEVAVYDED
ncbi:MAG: 16S rRNA processing protein RimM [Clostridiales bacterium]|nr:16S rRNA processing protein RimM [Clostridiales bacterium]